MATTGSNGGRISIEIYLYTSMRLHACYDYTYNLMQIQYLIIIWRVLLGVTFNWIAMFSVTDYTYFTIARLSFVW